jgi:hypothetical protein
VPDAGNGGGMTEIYSRMRFACHPVGFALSAADDTDAGAVAGTVDPTLTNLRTAGSWAVRAVERKQIALARLDTRANFATAPVAGP